MKTKPTRILSIDFGLSRLGLAISDERKIIATPLSTVLAEKKSEKTVAKMVEFIQSFETKQECSITEIIVGLPLMMNGSAGFLADEVKHFVDLLKQAISIPILLWDERLTTVQAERSLRESSMTRKKRTKIVDQVSAAIILQSYLDSKNLPQF